MNIGPSHISGLSEAVVAKLAGLDMVHFHHPGNWTPDGRPCPNLMQVDGWCSDCFDEEKRRRFKRTLRTFGFRLIGQSVNGRLCTAWWTDVGKVCIPTLGGLR